MSKFIILIPSYNEYFSLRKIIKSLIRNNNILILDDKSNDNTYLLKKKYKRLIFISNKNRLGYEQNIKKGFKISIRNNFKYIITFDADGEHHPSNINRIKKFINANKNIDLLIGNRSHLNRFSEKIISYFFKKKYNIVDPLSGLKIYKTSALKKIINKATDNCFLVDLVYYFIKNSYIINNLKIKSVKIKGRRSKVGALFVSNLKILKCLKFLF